MTKAPTALYRKIGTRIKALRISRDISAPGLAESMGVSLRRLTSIEAGTNITAEDLISAARGLGLPTTVLTEEVRYDEFMGAKEEAK